VRLEDLLITDYRNLQRVELRLTPGNTAFVGENAQGKSNLLEAIYLLATMRIARAETDVQVVRRDAMSDVLPAARVVATVARAEGPLKLELTVLARPGANGPVATKTVKVNGVARRLSQAVGRMTAVLFTAEDLAMITGPPSLRRRYLDMTLVQVDPSYAGARSRFERILTQRNSLLKRIREGLAKRDELRFWDDGLAKDGGLLFQRRAAALGVTAGHAAEAHDHLAPGEKLTIRYKPGMEIRGDVRFSEAETEEWYAASLAGGTERDVAAGMTLTGPHRDDVQFILDGLEASGFASRAQQRTIALSLRLAEARFLTDERGDSPILLLDDILSEMDANRRRSVFTAIGDVEQMLLTGTDLDRFEDGFLAVSSLYLVEKGSARPVDGVSRGAEKADS
jgi:DNA replication and repair protein RecF